MPFSGLRSGGVRRKQGGKMTELVIKIRDNSQVGLLLATLKRLVTAEGIDLSVEQDGQNIALNPSSENDARFEALVSQIIADALAGKIEPLTPEEEEREERELAAYGAQKAAELGITSDEDVYRLLDEHKKERRAPIAA